MQNSFALQDSRVFSLVLKKWIFQQFLILDTFLLLFFLDIKR